MTNFYSKAYSSVKEFHVAFGLDVAACWSPSLLQLRETLIVEEVREYLNEVSSFDHTNLLKEGCDVVYVLLGGLVALGLPFRQSASRSSLSFTDAFRAARVGDSPEVRQALSEKLCGTARWIRDEAIHLHGAKFDEAFFRVHDSNMSKLVDGKALYREDGKVIKGPNYQPPYLGDLV
jgi:predicted HAD superfamily Cof-like phosphohydrolase